MYRGSSGLGEVKTESGGHEGLMAFSGQEDPVREVGQKEETLV